MRKEVKSTCQEAKSVSSGDVIYQFNAKWVQCPLSALKSLDQMLEARNTEYCNKREISYSKSNEIFNTMIDFRV